MLTCVIGQIRILIHSGLWYHELIFYDLPSNDIMLIRDNSHVGKNYFFIISSVFFIPSSPAAGQLIGWQSSLLL